ncbi:hypothetical protein OL383_004416 [Salmonella enterica]|nr:hypothetical protein [Salmonella enterica]
MSKSNEANNAVRATSNGVVDEKRLQAMIPRELHQRFKLAAYADGKQINSVLIDLISDYLLQRERASK